MYLVFSTFKSPFGFQGVFRSIEKYVFVLSVLGWWSKSSTRGFRPGHLSLTKRSSVWRRSKRHSRSCHPTRYTILFYFEPIFDLWPLDSLRINFNTSSCDQWSNVSVAFQSRLAMTSTEFRQNLVLLLTSRPSKEKDLRHVVHKVNLLHVLTCNKDYKFFWKFCSFYKLWTLQWLYYLQIAYTFLFRL